MTAETNKVVSVTYELTATKNESELIEKTTVDRPLTFLMGRGFLLPKFEANLQGKKIGDNFDFILSAEDAYGTFNDSAVINIPITAFANEGEVNHDMLQIGRSIPMMDSEGNRLSGIVLEVTAESVKMDFNHPLADEDLHFKGEIVEIRDATKEEMEHGHIHQSGGCGGGCGGDDCESSGGGGCGSGCCS